MKTKTTMITWMAVLFMFCISCKKETPVIPDSTSPRIQYTISGGGFTTTFSSDVAFRGQLDLPPNTRFHITASVFDASGIKHLEVQFPTFVSFGTFTGLPSYTESFSGLSKFYNMNSTTTDPYSSFVLTGDVTTPNVGKNEALALDFFAYGFDFSNNTASVRIPILISHNPVYGYGWHLEF